MAYCSAATVLGLFPGLPQTSTVSGYSSTVALISSHITRADSMIDGKCARRYDVPFAETSTSTPPLIQTLSQDLAAYYTYRSKFTGDNANKFEYLDTLMQIALETLNQIQEGKMDVVGTGGAVVSEVSSSSKIYSSTESYTPAFDVDDEFDWKFDTDRIDAIRSARQ